MEKKTKVIILDTSVLLSGKPIHFTDAELVTTPGVSQELQPGGRDYRMFQLLKEKGLTIIAPSNESLGVIRNKAKETGDKDRLSPTDIEILAVAIDINKQAAREAIILSDDYAIQNIALSLHIEFHSISKRGITKRFKWTYRCRGCGKRLKESNKICPICGTEIKIILQQKRDIDKIRDKP